MVQRRRAQRLSGAEIRQQHRADHQRVLGAVSSGAVEQHGRTDVGGRVYGDGGGVLRAGWIHVADGVWRGARLVHGWEGATPGA